VRDVATSTRGTVALLAGSQLFVLEGADGSTRFTRTERVPSHGRMAMDPAGQVAIAGASGCGMGVTKYNLAGDLVWSRTIAPASCGGTIETTSIAIAGHDVVVSGQFKGAVDFGTGVQTAASPQGFLLDLQP